MSSKSLNKVLLIGNVTRDPELRYTPQGNAVCTFGLATNRSWKTDSGEVREETEFHRLVAWNKLAELCAQLCTKGRKIYVEGRLQTRSWTGADNLQHTVTEVVIDDMILLGGPPASGASNNGGADQATTQSSVSQTAAGDDNTTVKGGSSSKNNQPGEDDEAEPSEEELAKKKSGAQEDIVIDDTIPF